MKWPAVTAIINTYDRADLLPRALESVLKQTFTDFEVIVIHDGPADKATADICEEYAKHFDQRNVPFDFMALTENSGYQCVPKNVAVWHARGDYIAYLDDDNEWTPRHLEVLFEAIEEGTVWPDFTYGRREYFDTRAEKVPEVYVGTSPHVPWSEEATQRLASSATANFVDTSDFLVAKGALWRLHLATDMMWNEKTRRFGDWELITRGVFFAGWRGKAVDEVVQNYYWHGDNIQLKRALKETPHQARAGQ
jgi:glycosyltransferase involved in cell wall biosynthesis